MRRELQLLRDRLNRFTRRLGMQGAFIRGRRSDRLDAVMALGRGGLDSSKEGVMLVLSRKLGQSLRVGERRADHGREDRRQLGADRHRRPDDVSDPAAGDRLRGPQRPLAREKVARARTVPAALRWSPARSALVIGSVKPRGTADPDGTASAEVLALSIARRCLCWPQPRLRPMLRSEDQASR